ncbi:MAG: M48 family metallopeptidase [Verrucomicrobiota bacterium]
MWDLIRANKRKSVGLIVVLGLFFVVLGYVIGLSLDSRAGPSGVAIALAVWVVMMFASVAGGEKILLATAGAREVTHEQAPQLFNIVEEMKIASGLPVLPRVYVIDSGVPNAFAVGLTPKRAAVAVTTGLMGRLSRDELQGVIAHEIGHIANRDTLFMTLAGVTVGAIIILADLYLRGMRFSSGRSRRSSSRGGGQGAAIIMLIALLLAVLAPLLAQLLYFACSRRREYLADASSAQFTRYPAGLASALEKISSYEGEKLEVSRAVAPMFTVNPMSAASTTSNILSTHPPTADRIRVLLSMAGGSSFAAYEEAYRRLHGGKAVVGARNLAASAEGGVRAPSAAEPADPAKQWRSAVDVLHKANQYATVGCACGLNMKLPPGFDQKTVKCPRCGRVHEVPMAAVMAAMVAVDQGLNKPMPPVYKK